jgi:hypothetical protein
MAHIPITEVTNQEKVYNLYLELVEAKKDKKEAVKTHSDNIKRIEAEMQELADEEAQDKNDAKREAD